MDAWTLPDVVQFVKPLYQDLDGVSRFPDLERIATIAHLLYEPEDQNDSYQFELLLLFLHLGDWLAKPRNFSRAALTTSVPEPVLKNTAAAVSRLHLAPVTPREAAIASAILIDEAGCRGFAHRLATARRHGTSPVELAREELASDPKPPLWFSPRAAALFSARKKETRKFCDRILLEENGGDLQP